MLDDDRVTITDVRPETKKEKKGQAQKEIEKFYDYLKDITEHHAQISRDLYQDRGNDELKLRESIYQDGVKQGHMADVLAFKAMFRGYIN